MANEKLSDTAAGRVMVIHNKIRELGIHTQALIWRDLCMSFARQVDRFSGSLDTTEAAVKRATSGIPHDG